MVQAEKVLEVAIKPGWKNGTKIKFAGEGDELPTGQQQDLEFVLEQVPHATYTRDGDNLIYKVHDLTLVEALCGFTR